MGKQDEKTGGEELVGIFVAILQSFGTQRVTGRKEIRDETRLLSANTRVSRYIGLARLRLITIQCTALTPERKAKLDPYLVCFVLQ